jgi:hypothetical protein
MRKKSILIGIFFCLFTIIMLRYWIKIYKLKREGKITSAVITSYICPGRGQTSLKFSYVYNDILYDGSYGTNRIICDSLYQYKGRNLVLVILPSDPSLCELLVTHDDFERYNIAYPDSLKWIRHTLKWE